MSEAPRDGFDPDTDDVLQRFVAAALEMRAQGIDPPLDEICKTRPDLVDSVSQALAMSERIPMLHGRARTHDPVLGRTLGGRYRIDSAVGAGAMGVVYRGTDLELRRPIAVKVLRTDLFGGDEAEARFLREAESLAALNHPAVVTVHDRGTIDELHYLVMELVAGCSLANLLDTAAEQAARDGGPDRVEHVDWVTERLARDAESTDDDRPHTELESTWLRQAVRWIAELASGVEAAHESGIYHRDIKPSNVLIDRDGRAVLIDFGIVAREEHATLRERDDALGTPAYMAPEQLATGGAPKPGLDVYGLTATLYHLLTLRAPYLGTPSQVIARVMRRDPTPAYRVRADLPRDLQAILDRGMARDPRRRYARARDLETDLHAFLAHRPVTARPLTPLGRAWRGLRRSREFRVLATVAVLVAMIAGTLLIDDAVTRSRHVRWLATLERLPPELALSPNRAARTIADPVTHREVTALLDDLTEYAAWPVPSNVLRAAFRHDLGDVDGAIVDITTVADALGTDYSRTLLARYRSAEGGAAADVELDGMPMPVTGDDCYLHAFHLLRTGLSPANISAAHAALTRPEAADHLAASELLISVENVRAKRLEDRSNDCARFAPRTSSRSARSSGWER